MVVSSVPQSVVATAVSMTVVTSISMTVVAMSITITTSIVTIVGIGISIGFSFTFLAARKSLNGPSHVGGGGTRVSSYSRTIGTESITIGIRVSVVATIVSTIVGIGIGCGLSISSGLSFTLLAAIHRTASIASGRAIRCGDTWPVGVGIVECRVVAVTIVGIG